MSDIPYLDTLRGDLIGAVDRRRRRGARRRRAALVAAPVAIAVAAVVAVTSPGGTSPALAIARQGDWVELRIADVDAGQAAMERELRDAGIDAEIRVMPVADALVGRWACVGEIADGDPVGPDLDGAGPHGARYEVRLHEVRFDAELVSLRRDFAAGTQDGRLVFVAGRAARVGEAADSEPCRSLIPPPRPGAKSPLP